MSDALTMTPEQLQEIRERAEKATPGKFCLTADLENLQFHARTDIPKLLDEIEVLEKALLNVALAEFSLSRPHEWVDEWLREAREELAKANEAKE